MPVMRPQGAGGAAGSKPRVDFAARLPQATRLRAGALGRVNGTRPELSAADPELEELIVMAESPELSKHRRAVVLSMPPRSAGAGSWEPWLSEQAVAGQFGVSTRTVRRWRVAGMPSRVFGRVRRYRMSDCERWHTAREPA
jgi:hypothetical protein